MFGKLEHLDSKAVFDLKRAPLHCATDELGVKEICKSKLIKCKFAGSSRNLTELAFERSNVWFENLASRFLGKRSRVWARDGKSGRSLESKFIFSTKTIIIIIIIIITITMACRHIPTMTKSHHGGEMS